MTIAKSGHFCALLFAAGIIFRCKAFTSAYLVSLVDCRHTILSGKIRETTNRRKRETTAKKIQRRGTDKKKLEETKMKN